MEGETIERVRLDVPDVADGDRDEILDAVSGVDGVRDVEVLPDAHAVEISYDPREVSANKLQQALAGAGYHGDIAADVQKDIYSRPGIPSETE